MLLSTEGWRETQSGEVEVTLAGHSPDAVRGVLGWMNAVGGPPKREAAAMCLVPELVARKWRSCPTSSTALHCSAQRW